MDKGILRISHLLQLEHVYFGWLWPLAFDDHILFFTKPLFIAGRDVTGPFPDSPLENSPTMGQR